uniref:EGF-like domain-containing protein n=1 Tax=Anopheles culicifacies TaxID=139723 RepID=A0A182MBF9_9DIPT
MQLYAGVLFLLLQLSLTSAKHYYDVIGEPSVTYELVCPENEELRETMPCCEPTCDNDCTTAKCSKSYVRQPTCVCKQGYVRHKGKCILLRHCPAKPPSPLTCAENEELLPSPPSCEPTCTEDCAGRPVHSRYVDQPTCVCKKGYRRHKGKCIRVDQCPSCGPYATLKANVPCCEPTCENDCRNVLCVDGYKTDEPVCVCQDGYVKHNSTCIKRELCPQTAYPAPVQYCRCGVKRRPKGRVPVPVKYVEVNTPAPCGCYKQQGNDYYPSVTYSPHVYPAMNYALPETTTYAPPKYSPQQYTPPAYQPQSYAAPPTYAPPNYAPGPYVPAPTNPPPNYVSGPYVPNPPKYVPGPYVSQPSYGAPQYVPDSYTHPPPYAVLAYTPPPPCHPPVYTPPPPCDPPVYTPPSTCAPPVYTTPPPCAPPVYTTPPPCGPPVYTTPPPCGPPVYTPPPPCDLPVYTPPPTCAPPVYTPPPTCAPPVYTPPPTTCAPPTAPPKQYYQQPAYDVPPPPPPPYSYNQSPVVESSTYESVTVEPPYAYPSVNFKPYYQQPPSSYQDQPYYAIPALKQCSCAYAGQVTSSPPCGCGKPAQMYNRPPISYNVATPSTTTAAPTTTICPPCCGCNQCVQQYGPPSYHQDQPYLQQPETTPEPLPVDVSYIQLPFNCTNAVVGSGPSAGAASILSATV